jgi:hypothetical protein
VYSVVIYSSWHHISHTRTDTQGWNPGDKVIDTDAHDEDKVKVDAIMRKLRRVKTYAKKAKSHKPQPGARLEKAGKETMLVQPAPLLGALPVRDGELYRLVIVLCCECAV